MAYTVAATKKGAAPGWVLLKEDTGFAAGAALLGPRFKYESSDMFDADFEKHRVPKGDPFAFGGSQRKRATYGFPVLDVILTEQVAVVSNGRVRGSDGGAERAETAYELQHGETRGVSTQDSGRALELEHISFILCSRTRKTI